MSGRRPAGSVPKGAGPDAGQTALVRLVERIGTAPGERWQGPARRLPPTREAAEALAAEGTRLLRVDLDRAERLSGVLAAVARAAGGASQGIAWRLAGHLAYQRGRYGEALRAYAAARHVFAGLGEDLELARVLAASANAHTQVGRYARATALAHRARRIFIRQGDALRAARVDANLAMLLFRRDRAEEALRLGQRALRTFERAGAVDDIAITLLNTASRLTALHEFVRARRVYQRTLAFCARHGLPLLRVEAEGNLAYLHAQRGEYQQALAMYDRARARADAAGHESLTAALLLDEAELLVELNALERAAPVAAEALARSRARRLRYEEAKARTLLAIVEAGRGRHSEALALFDQARRAFASEQNLPRIALTDCYRALVLGRQGELAEAASLALVARQELAGCGLGAKVALADLLLARFALEAGELDQARRHLVAVHAQLRRFPSPALAYQAAFLAGELEHALGRPGPARAAYRRAHRTLEGLRSHLAVEELRIAFLDDKGVIYESMVRNCLQGRRPTRLRVARAYGYVQQAKSRALAELLARGGHDTSLALTSGPLRLLRAELNACYREVERLESAPGGPATRNVSRWRARARQYERRLSDALFDARRRDPGLAEFAGGGPVPLEQVQATLGDAVLIEYFEVRGMLHAIVADRRRAAARVLGPVDALRRLVRLALFNLCGVPVVARVGAQGRLLDEATAAHLRSLRRQLVEPLADRLALGQHLVIAAHGSLHHVPFHALLGERGFLGDEHPISLTPSGSVFALGAQRPAGSGRGALVLGVADRRAPRITEEAVTVARCLGDATLRLGARASERALRTIGASCRVVHVATHGFFRDQQPMLSSIRLANTQLSVVDLYTLRLSADLVTLSGCSTGASVVTGGDELLGLSRGLLHAGAACVQLSLWNVDDDSATGYMSSFYRHYAAGRPPALAAQRAAAETRERFPHPYHWAPFVVVGRAG